jgi:O-antigen ligase
MSTAIENHGSNPAVERPERLPTSVALGVFLMMATSSLVLVEPAPCDLLFVVFAPLYLLTGYFALIRSVNPLIYFGLGLFVAMNIVSMVMAHEPLVSARYWGITIYLVLFWLMIVALMARFGPRLYRVINDGFQVAAVVTSTVGILAGLKLIPNWQVFMLDAADERIRGTFKDANVLGPYLVAAIAMIVADILVAKRIKLWQIACLTLYGLAILLTFSRGAYLAAVVTMAALLGSFWLIGKYRPGVDWLLFRLLPVGLAFAIVGVVILARVNLTDYFVNRFAYQSYDDERFENQQHILRTVGQMPIGIGPGSWNLHHYLHDVHSLFLRTWVEHGHLGLMGLLCFLGAWFFQSWRAVCHDGPNQSIYIVCFAVVLGVMSNSFSIDTVHWRHLFLFLAIPVGLIAYEVQRSIGRSALRDEPIRKGFGSQSPHGLEMGQP